MDDAFEDETTLTLKRGVTLDAVGSVDELPLEPGDPSEPGEDLMVRCFVKAEGVFYVFVNGTWRPAPW